jgi:hypothetical protein
MIHHPDGSVTAPEYEELDRRLRTGDGLGFSGDPRLWLGEGVVENTKTGQIVARRLEVWRDNEDGSTTLIGSWHPSEQHRILYDLAQMRADAPGHVDVLDKIDAHNDVHEAKVAQQAHDAMYEAMEHALRLHHDRNNPRTKFYMNGDENRGGRA